MCLADCCANCVDSAPVVIALAGVTFYAVKYSHAEPYQDASHFSSKETEVDIRRGDRQDEGH